MAATVGTPEYFDQSARTWDDDPMKRERARLTAEAIAAATDQRSWVTLRTSRARPAGVNRAEEWMFIRFASPLLVHALDSCTQPRKRPDEHSPSMNDVVRHHDWPPQRAPEQLRTLPPQLPLRFAGRAPAGRFLGLHSSPASRAPHAPHFP
jgi:hypothetical protein